VTAFDFRGDQVRLAGLPEGGAADGWTGGRE
jgi:hypothetical protein